MHLWNDTVRGFHERLVELKSQATADSYVSAVRLWETFLVSAGVSDLSMANPGLLDDFVRHMLKRGGAPSTVTSRVTGVKAWLAHLKRIGASVPDFMSPDLPKVQASDAKVLTMDELAAYFDRANAMQEPVRTALMLMPLSGLRSDEVVRLKLSSMSIVDGWVVFSFDGKGKKHRKVPLLKQGNPTLRGYLTGFRAEYRSKVENDWLFPGHHLGTHMSTRTVRKWAEIISKEIGIEELSPHVLRKTYTTMLDSMGVSPLMIAQLVGHSSLRTTSKHYVHHEVGTLVSELARIHIPGVLLKTRSGIPDDVA